MENFIIKLYSGFKKFLYNDTFCQFIRYVITGGISAVVDFLTLLMFNALGVHYLISVSLSFLIGLIINYILSKLFVFNKIKSNVNSVFEFVIYLGIGLVGLIITESLMFLFVDFCSFQIAYSKIITMIIVLFWNFFARKNILYKKGVK